MLQRGFDYAYDKRLYDRLRDGHVRPVPEHLQAGLDYQNKLVRFLENHDEPRIASILSETGGPGRRMGRRTNLRRTPTSEGNIHGR